MDRQIDIYIQSHRRPHYLFATLEAIQRRSKYKIRIRIANNGECEDTREVIEMFNRRRINIKSIECENSPYSREELIDTFPPASDYMVFLDDDIIVPELWDYYLTKLINDNRENRISANFIGCGVASFDIDETDRPPPKNPLTPKQWRDGKRPMVWCTKEDAGEFYVCNAVGGLLLTRPEFYARIGTFERDCMFCERLSLEGFFTAMLKSPTMRHLGYNTFYDYPKYNNERIEYFEQYTNHKPRI